MKAVILAAGQGSRLRPLTENTPKNLLPYRGKPILRRMVEQLRSLGIEDLYIVVGFEKQKIIEELGDIPGIRFIENHKYKDDINVYSMQLALEAVVGEGEDDVLVIEADIICEPELLNYISGTDFEHQSVWFTSGSFHAPQYGGILKTDGHGQIVDIRLVPEFDEQYRAYEKITGLMRIASLQVPVFLNLVQQYAAITTKQYYLVPWLENLDQLPAVRGDASHYSFGTFNTAEDYARIQEVAFDPSSLERDVSLVSLDSLKPIEAHDATRFEEVRGAVIKDSRWTQPLRIESEHGLVLDGHHRLEIARAMKLTRIPVIGFRYEEVDMWTLREEIPLDRQTVINHALAGKLYPYKTVKHKFPRTRLDCDIAIEDLR